MYDAFSLKHCLHVWRPYFLIKPCLLPHIRLVGKLKAGWTIFVHFHSLELTSFSIPVHTSSGDCTTHCHAPWPPAKPESPHKRQPKSNKKRGQTEHAHMHKSQCLKRPFTKMESVSVVDHIDLGPQYNTSHETSTNLYTGGTTSHL